ncbi:leghemoglobin-2-like [Prosopis cineraria]|uniref:leghemoglobin-2-like n=1 Tax=Prosopis cineraria TaxID=364024 RepID=UPI0024107E91|nr:leghemoglobin-2-like [Prosopis cineraria]
MEERLKQVILKLLGHVKRLNEKNKGLCGQRKKEEQINGIIHGLDEAKKKLKMAMGALILLVGNAPTEKDLFPFLKGSNEILKNNPQLEAQALKVFKLTFESTIQLREKGGVVIANPAVNQLSSVHVQKGVVDTHFEVVKEALLKTVKEVARAKWSEDLNNAWAKAYDGVAALIKKEMKEI